MSKTLKIAIATAALCLRAHFLRIEIDPAFSADVTIPLLYLGPTEYLLIYYYGENYI